MCECVSVRVVQVGGTVTLCDAEIGGNYSKCHGFNGLLLCSPLISHDLNSQSDETRARMLRRCVFIKCFFV